MPTCLSCPEVTSFSVLSSGSSTCGHGIRYISSNVTSVCPPKLANTNSMNVECEKNCLPQKIIIQFLLPNSFSVDRSVFVDVEIILSVETREIWQDFRDNHTDHKGPIIKPSSNNPKQTYFIVSYHHIISCTIIDNTLSPRQNRHHFADDMFKYIENVWFPIKISLKFVPKGPINNFPALVQIKAWRRPGDKQSSESMVVSLPTHICVTRPQWDKQWVATLVRSQLHFWMIHWKSRKNSIRRQLLGLYGMYID